MRAIASFVGTTCCALLAAAGCSAAVSDAGGRVTAMIPEPNPIRTIAIVGSARVVWPTVWDNEVLGLDESRLAADRLIAEARTQLEAKGYAVVGTGVPGLGLGSPAWVMTTDLAAPAGPGGERTVKSWKVQVGGLAQSCPVEGWPEPSCDAARHVLATVHSAFAARLMEFYAPPKRDLKLIAAQTGADTICVIDLTGRMFTDARRTGVQVAKGALDVARWTMPTTAGTVPYGSAHATDDSFDAVLLLLKADTGEVMWRQQVGMKHTPIDPSAAIRSSLTQLPSIQSSAAAPGF